MKNFEKKITFIIVSYNSNHIIENCLLSIKSNIKIIVIENSKNHYFKIYLEKKFPNVKVIISGKNLGYGAGNNLGVLAAKTPYVFILNPDTELKKNSLKELYSAITFLKNQFTILAPNLLNNYGYFTKQKKEKKLTEKKLLEVDYVKGFAMLINLKNIRFLNKKKLFDKNFFLFLEEIDLCKRINKLGGKIFVAIRSEIKHTARSASGYNLRIELCRNWHWMWSLFYYNKKHFGTFVAYKITFQKFISSIIKLFFAIIFFNKKKIFIHFYRLFGLCNAYLKKSSWLRPEDVLV
jgi:GT2 family glycosyltransferase